MSEEVIYSPEQALARDVLIIAVNGGITHWARVHGYQVDCPPEQVSAEGVDVEDDRSLWRVTLPDLQDAITKIAENPGGCVESYQPDSEYGELVELLRSVRTQLSDGAALLDIAETAELDGAAADMIFQVATCGEVIYG